MKKASKSEIVLAEKVGATGDHVRFENMDSDMQVQTKGLECDVVDTVCAEVIG